MAKSARSPISDVHKDKIMRFQKNLKLISHGKVVLFYFHSSQNELSLWAWVFFHGHFALFVANEIPLNRFTLNIVKTSGNIQVYWATERLRYNLRPKYSLKCDLLWIFFSSFMNPYLPPTLKQTSGFPQGVPQGSILSPLPFPIYRNDLPNCLEFTTHCLYATQIFASSIEGNFLANNINLFLSRKPLWLAHS